MSELPSDFNPTDPGFLANPYPFYELGRRHAPVSFHAPSGLWSIFGYGDVQAVLRDHQTWSSFQGPATPPGAVEAPQPSMLGSDPPRHHRLRELVSQAFTPRMVEQLEPRIRALANELLDGVDGQSEADIVATLSYPLPVIVIAEILGIPPEDRAQFKRWSDAVVSTLGAGEERTEGMPPQSLFDEFYAYLGGAIEERRAHPRADLISALVAAEMEGTKLNLDELVQMLVLLLVAGNETTTNLIGNAIQAFIAHPDQLSRLRADPALLPSAIEEVLRFESPVQATVRRATREVNVGGVTIDAGQSALIWLASANRDPAAFPSPDSFDITRTPNRHVGFGLGIHFCLGAPLARLEARLALEAFLARYREFARADNCELPRVPTFIMHGVRELPLTLVLA